MEKTLKECAGEASVLHISTHGFFFPDLDDISDQTVENEKDIVETMNFRGIRKIDSISRSGATYMNWNFVTNKNPLMRSGLVLAGANDIWQRDPFEEGEDGILTAQEVSNLNLMRTKLVVLSACETGLGDIKGSEGVFGLQRAFKMAGAHYLIMSLWQVPDVETAEFMEVFYKNLSKKKDIRKAFQLTQRVMHKKYDPYYWAAFVLIE
jgi:CHAT domain-containing protein